MMNNQRTYRRTGNLSVYVKGPNVASTIALDNLDLEFAQDDLDSYLRMVSTAFFVRGGNMLQSDIQSWIDVRDHGAVGDGITNDTNAVQAAIEAAETLGNLSTVYIPTGFNCLVDPLVLTTGITIVGGGFTKQNNYQGNGVTYSIKESALTLRSGTRLFSPITNVTDISGFSLIGLSMYGRGREAGYDDGAVVGWGEGAASYGETDANTLATSKLSFRFCKFSNFGRNGIELSDAGFQLEICYNYFTNCGQFGGVSGGRGDLSLKRGGIFLYNNTFYRPTLGSTSGANADTGSVIKGNYFGGCARGIGVDGQAQHINYGEANIYEFCDVGIEVKNSIGLNITGAKFEGCYTAGVIAPTVVSLGHFEHASSGSNSVQAATNYIYTKGSSLFLNRTSNGSSIELDISERATNDRGLYINATLPKTVYEVNGSSGANGLTRIQASGNGGVYFQVNTSTNRDFSTLLSWFYRDSTGNICLDTGGSGTVSFSNSRLTNLAAPTSSGDAVSLGYLSSIVTDLNLLYFGADSTGATDSSAAIQAAINAAVSTRRTLRVPSGTYKMDSGVTIPGRITIVGDGMNSSIFNYTSVNGDAFSWTADGTYSSISKIKVINNNTRVVGDTSIGFHTYESSACVFYRWDECWVEGFAMWGILLNDSFQCSFTNGRIRNNGKLATLAGLGVNGQGGGIGLSRITFTGACTTGNDFSNSYITGNNVGIKIISNGANDRAFNTRIDNCIFEYNYIGIDLRGSVDLGRYQFLNTCYFEQNYFAGAFLDEGTTIACYQNDTTAGTGTPPSVSLDGKDGINIVRRYVVDRPSRFEIGNNALTDNVAFKIDKNEGSNNISLARFAREGALQFGYDGLTSTSVTTINSGSGNPEGVVTANSGSLYLRNNGSDTGNTLYLKVDGDATNTGWYPLGAVYGTTANRPTAVAANKGVRYYDTDIARTVVSNGAGVWREYNGLTTVTNTMSNIPSHIQGASFYATNINHLLTSDGTRWRSVLAPTTIATCSNGGTTTIVSRGAKLINTNTSTIATHTVIMPSSTSAVTGDRVEFITSGEITGITVTAGAATVNGAPTTLAANSSFEYIYNDATTTWYRIR